jgi:hypothetical protein
MIRLTGPDPDQREKFFEFFVRKVGTIIALAIPQISYVSTNNRPANKRRYDKYIRFTVRIKCGRYNIRHRDANIDCCSLSVTFWTLSVTFSTL